MNKHNLDYYNQFTLTKNDTKTISHPTMSNKIEKQDKNNKKGTFFHIVVILLALSILIFIANAFSNLLAFSTVTIYENNAITLNSYDVFMLEIDEFDNKKDAEKCAEKIKLRGAGGNIIYDSTYKVIASCYTNIIDAENVLEKIKSQYPNASIYTMQLNRLSLDKSNDDKEFENIDNTLQIFKICAEKLSNLAFELDESKINSMKVKNELIKLFSKSNEINKKFDNFSASSSDNKMVIARAKINQVCEVIKHLIDDNNTSIRLSSQLKENAITCYLLQNELALLIA